MVVNERVEIRSLVVKGEKVSDAEGGRFERRSKRELKMKMKKKKGKRREKRRRKI